MDLNIIIGDIDTYEKEENVKKTFTKELMHKNNINKSKGKLFAKDILIEDINMGE